MSAHEQLTAYADAHGWRLGGRMGMTSHTVYATRIGLVHSRSAATLEDAALLLLHDLKRADEEREHRDLAVHGDDL